MANISRNFTAGKMNKVVDERLVPNGEYIDAMNVRMGSTEQAEIGVIENTKGNLALTALTYIDGTPLSAEARCIGAFADGANETLYWFVHDPNFTGHGPVERLDLIVSYNVLSTILTYHVVAINDGSDLVTSLNFNPNYLITGINKVDNLLFFTDDYNQPRFINVLRTYPIPINNIDAGSEADANILKESLLVIKRPPTESPGITLIKQGEENNYLETRFVSFAYRYRYIDGEYSATSQWSDIAFEPGAFDFSYNSLMGEGMQNAYNTAIISYNTGSSLVVGIDLLFKQAENNVIKVIEKLDKSLLGLPNDTVQTFAFSNSKIFTVLSEGEILRLYDNVPRLAKAQTIMGNRLMYGNYVEGYDLVTKFDTPTRLEYQTELISDDIDDLNFDSSKVFFESGNYTFGGGGTFADAVLCIDFSGFDLSQPGLIYVNFTLDHGSFYGDTPFPTEITEGLSFSFAFNILTGYSSAYEMGSSPEFQQAVGTALNILPIFSPIVGDQTSCDGITWTDQLNCAVPTDLVTPNGPGSVSKYQSGISADLEPIAILIDPSSTIIKLQFPAIRYVDDPMSLAPTQSVYEVFSCVLATVSFRSSKTTRSLHSNRGYEIGIVYMDEFGRSSTALVSPYNTEHVPCYASGKQNHIKVTIPVTQVAPWWAKRYKFVCKASEESYNVIYSSLYFTAESGDAAYFLLEGENIQKVEAGDRYIVKRDKTGPLTTCTYATVLEKEVQPAGFIVAQNGINVPEGVYMKIKPEGFNTTLDENSVIIPGPYTDFRPKQVGTTSIPWITYPMNIYDGTSWVDYTVPAGSQITISLKIVRPEDPSIAQCNNFVYDLNIVLSSTADYNNMYDWWIGDGVTNYLSEGFSNSTPSFCQNIEFLPGLNNSPISILAIPASGCNAYLGFWRDVTDNRLYLIVRGPRTCPGFGGQGGWSVVSASFKIVRSSGLIVFETLPVDTAPDIFYENNLSFPIDDTGNHLSNGAPGDISQDIGLGIAAEIETGFFNCFSFGNGVESYKIRDSIIGRAFNLGERVTAVSAQNYKEADRFADITYSGVFNQETNVNKLNEFNLGLVNYKNLEASFGDLHVLDGRETDILALQEDKISYVLAGKNLLSDASAGNLITSVPEVLGTQIARTENYGITSNPESYVQWGYDRYFTDAKRGVVLQLKGNAYSNEQLNVVSEMGMRTWFRDQFINSFNTQKIGGYDPYMNEYVLTLNDIALPGNPQCLDCGKNQSFNLFNDTEEVKSLNFCVDLSALVGAVDISWIVNSIDEGASFEVTATYNGDETTSGFVSESGSITFDKNSITEEVVDIQVNYLGNVSLSLLIKCPLAIELNVVEVVVTSLSDANDTIHTQFRYVDGPFIGPLQSNQVTFASGNNPIVSRYNIMTGNTGTGLFPTDGSTVYLQTNKVLPDNYQFLLFENSFRYLRSNVLYENNPTDISNLLSNSFYIPPTLINTNLFSGSFTMPPSAAGEYIYMIWDLRNKKSNFLCYTPTSEAPAGLKDICCECAPCSAEEYPCSTFTVNNISAENTATVHFASDCIDNIPFTIELDPGEETQVCAQSTSFVFEVRSGDVTVELTDCTQCTPCYATCETWTAYKLKPAGSSTQFAGITFIDCDTQEPDFQIVENGYLYQFCQPVGSPAPVADTSGYIIEKQSNCGCCAVNTTCTTWNVLNNDIGEPTDIDTFTYYDCNNILQTISLSPGQAVNICVTYDPNYQTVPILSSKWSVSLVNPCNCSAFQCYELPLLYAKTVVDATVITPSGNVQQAIVASPVVFQLSDWGNNGGTNYPLRISNSDLSGTKADGLVTGQTYKIEITFSEAIPNSTDAVKVTFGRYNGDYNTGPTTYIGSISGNVTTPQVLNMVWNPLNLADDPAGIWMAIYYANLSYAGNNGTVTVRIFKGDECVEPIALCQSFQNVGVIVNEQFNISPNPGQFPIVLQGNNWSGSNGNSSPRFKDVSVLPFDPNATLVIGQTYSVQFQLNQVYAGDIHFWLGTSFDYTSIIPPDAIILGSTTDIQTFCITYNPTDVGATNFAHWLRLTSASPYNGTLTIEMGNENCSCILT